MAPAGMATKKAAWWNRPRSRGLGAPWPTGASLSIDRAPGGRSRCVNGGNAAWSTARIGRVGDPGGLPDPFRNDRESLVLGDHLVDLGVLVVAGQREMRRLRAH